MDNDRYVGYYDYSPATHQIPDYDRTSFFLVDDENDSDFEGFYSYY